MACVMQHRTSPHCVPAFVYKRNHLRTQQIWLFHPTIISGGQETCGQRYEVQQYCVMGWDDVSEEPRGQKSDIAKLKVMPTKNHITLQVVPSTASVFRRNTLSVIVS